MWDNLINLSTLEENIDKYINKQFYCMVGYKEDSFDGIYILKKDNNGDYYFHRRDEDMMINNASLGAFKQFILLD